jgi:Protein of unknown function (DUF4238)
MTARKHHYIPQCYLKRFCSNAGKQLTVFDRRKPKPFPSHTKNVAVENDFNRVDIEGYPRDVVEAKYATFEVKVDQALKRIDQRSAFDDPQDQAILFNFIGAAYSA